VPYSPTGVAGGFLIAHHSRYNSSMLQHKTAIVVGAGASCCYGLPTGDGLLREIVKLCQETMNRDYKRVANANFTIDRYENLKKLIEESNCSSIDDLLSTYTELSEVGKFLIAACLFPLENPKVLFDFERKSNSWMVELFRKMATDDLATFAKNPVTFITFNYDRSLDYYLRRQLAIKYRADESAVETVMESIPIIHVHGQLGTLAEMPYGAEHFKHGAGKVRKASDGIKIIHEADPQSPEFDRAAQSLREADRIGIMGFGFHETNIKRLRLKDAVKDKYLAATTLGLPPLAQRNIKFRLGPVIEFREQCLDLLRDTELL
jgi:hypothetical protein